MNKALALTASAGVIFATLALPNHPDALDLPALRVFPLELPIVLLVMIAVGRRVWLIWPLAAALMLVAILKIADIGMFTAYDRSFNPVLDAFLFNSGLGLLRDSIGAPLTYLSLALLAVVIALWFLALVHSLRVWSSLKPPIALRATAAVAALGFGFWALADASHHLGLWHFDRSPPGTTRTTTLAYERIVQTRETAADLVRFSRDARSDIYADATGLLGRLEGRDVLLIFIESYGRASFDNALYAPTHVATLRAAEDTLRDAGFALRSGWLTSPTAGGQSWLAHGALTSGLWTSDNGRYTAMLASGAKGLFHLAQDAGYRTAAFMPAITMPWPESRAMGFDLVYPAAAMGYEGERFNWVTMPDQFTLAAYRDLLPDDPRPDFIQIALISSHAPWVPVPQMVPWEDVGNGTIFNEMAARGPTPRELWQDHDDVRAAYRHAIDYSLKATLSHVARLGEDAPLIIIAGDHQPAGFVAGSDNRDVAVHLIGPQDLVDMTGHWGWTEGLVPAADAPVRRMDTFRNDFIAAFSEPTKLAGAQP